MRRIIREEEPPQARARGSARWASRLRDRLGAPQSDPRQLGRLVRGELDWIVMKALEKDRTRRYETANASGDGRAAVPERRAGAGVPAVGAYRLRQVRPATLDGWCFAFRRSRWLCLLAVHRHDRRQPASPASGTRRRRRCRNRRSPGGKGRARCWRPGERAEGQRPVVPGAAEPGPRAPLQPPDGPAAGQPGRRWPKPPASAPTSGCATRPLPPWPCPTSASARCRPRHRGRRLRWRYRLLRRIDDQGISASSPLPGQREIRRIDIERKHQEPLWLSRDGQFPGRARQTARCRSGALPTGSRSSGKNCPAAAISRSVQTAGSWRSRQDAGSFAFDLASGAETRWRLPAAVCVLGFSPGQPQAGRGLSPTQGRFHL